MNNFKDLMRRIDWELLRSQKEHLLTKIDPLLEGILHLIDEIQDAAVDDGIATEQEVFGKAKYE